MYLHEEHYYLISNHAVARNPIFCDPRIQVHFRNKMEYYLEPLCDILAYNLKDQEFQILVRLKEREVFEAYFESRNEDFQGLQQIPESTYLFSQAMSNLQVSLVKKFNFLYQRRGTLMAGRFLRELITCKDKVIDYIQMLNEGKQERRQSGIWADCAMKRISGMTSEGVYRLLEKSYCGSKDSFWENIKSNLVGPLTIPPKNEDQFKFYFQQRRLFKSICRYFE